MAVSSDEEFDWEQGLDTPASAKKRRIASPSPLASPISAMREASVKQEGWANCQKENKEVTVESWRAPIMQALHDNNFLRGAQLRPVQMSCHCHGVMTFARSLKVVL